MAAEAFHVEALIFVLILVVYVLTSHIIDNKKIPYLHESSIAIIMGVITAVVSKYVLIPAGRPSGRKSTSPTNYSSPSSSLPSYSRPATASGSPSSLKTSASSASSASSAP